MTLDVNQALTTMYIQLSYKDHLVFGNLSTFFCGIIYGVKFCMRKIGQILGSIYVQGFETDKQ